MLCYGLTGGIGSGKSTVVALFRKAGLPAIECDLLGRELLSRTDIARAVVDRHPACRSADGGVDRKRLSRIIFSQVTERRWLEALLHPVIWHRVKEWSRSLGKGICLVEGAVLLESPWAGFRRLAGLVVVTAPWPTRLRRVMRRDGVSEEEVEARRRCQLPEEEKILAADILIDNGGSLESTRWQVGRVVRMLRGEYGGEA